ncbi:MAG: group II truncated hemoglobin [Planctomycetota bacterium]
MQPTTHGFGPENLPYDAIGGESAVRALVDAFYDEMGANFPRLRGIHPDDDAESRDKLFEFLSGWLGGPPLYIQKHGHPRLRMRHAPFPIDQQQVDDWLACMGIAMDKQGIDGPLRVFLDERFAHTANFMRNA